MYVTYMEEIPYDYYKKNTILFESNVTLCRQDEIENILDFINVFGVDEYKKMFNIIDIKYNTISDNGLTYTTSTNELLPVSRLSSGQRALLYCLVMSRLNKPIIIIGLADRLDRKHREIILNNPDMFKTTVTVVYIDLDINCELIDRFYISFEDIKKVGLIP